MMKIWKNLWEIRHFAEVYSCNQNLRDRSRHWIWLRVAFNKLQTRLYFNRIQAISRSTQFIHYKKDQSYGRVYYTHTKMIHIPLAWAARDCMSLAMIITSCTAICTWIMQSVDPPYAQIYWSISIYLAFVFSDCITILELFVENVFAWF